MKRRRNERGQDSEVSMRFSRHARCLQKAPRAWQRWRGSRWAALRTRSRARRCQWRRSCRGGRQARMVSKQVPTAFCSNSSQHACLLPPHHPSDVGMIARNASHAARWTLQGQTRKTQATGLRWLPGPAQCSAWRRRGSRLRQALAAGCASASAIFIIGNMPLLASFLSYMCVQPSGCTYT